MEMTGTCLIFRTSDAIYRYIDFNVISAEIHEDKQFVLIIRFEGLPENKFIYIEFVEKNEEKYN